MQNEKKIDNNDISFSEIFIIIKRSLNIIKKNKISLTLIVLIGGIIGYFYSTFLPTIFSAKTTFILEDSKSSATSLGGLVSLAGQFGVDVGGSTNGGMLSGDNIILYLKSPSLAREVLLTKFDETNNFSIADYYSRVYKLGIKWAKNINIGNVKFDINQKGTKYTRVQDSLLNEICERIITKQFSVSRPDKKSSFIDVVTTMEDEQLAKIYCERLVKLAVEKYIEIKTQRQKSTVDLLQARLDSISKLLQAKTLTGASLQTNAGIMDINPLYKINNNVSLETTLRDKTLLSTIFASVTQNLEIAKFSLSQETPVIQIIDSPNFPLKSIKPSSLRLTLTFMFLFFLLGSMVILISDRLKKN